MLARVLTRLVPLLGALLTACTMVPGYSTHNVKGGPPLVCDGRTACSVHIVAVTTANGQCTLEIDHEEVYVDPKLHDVDIIWSVDPQTGSTMQADSVELKDTSRYANFDQRYPIHDDHLDALPMHQFHWRAHNVEHEGGNRYPYTLVLYDRENRRCVGDPVVISPGRP